VTLGFQEQVADVVATLLMQPPILLSFQKKVTTPAWLTWAVMVMVVPLDATVADAVSETVTDAEADGVLLKEFEARPSPRFDTALISI
jgi:hypothetical protein